MVAVRDDYLVSQSAVGVLAWLRELMEPRYSKAATKKETLKISLECLFVKSIRGSRMKFTAVRISQSHQANC